MIYKQEDFDWPEYVKDAQSRLCDEGDKAIEAAMGYPVQEILVRDAERRAANYNAPQDNPLLADAMKRAQRAKDRG